MSFKNIVIGVLFGTNLMTGWMLNKWVSIADGVYLVAYNSYKTGCLINKGKDCNEQSLVYIRNMKRFTGE